MPHSPLLGSVRFVQGTMGVLSAFLHHPDKQWQTNGEGFRIESYAFIIHCLWVVLQLCQDCHAVYLKRNSSVSHWKKFKVKMKQSKGTQLHSASSWHLHYRSVGGPLQHFSIIWFIVACSECSLLSNSGTTPTWANRSVRNVAGIWTELHWLRMFVLTFSSSTTFTVNV